jgi:hypothetical protein
MYEEPEEVKALMEYLCDFFVKFGEKMHRLLQAGHCQYNRRYGDLEEPVFLPEMYQELFKPYHARQAKLGTDRGLPIEMHDCGRCEDFIDDWRDFGVVSWNPAQTSKRSARDQKESTATPL